MKHFSLLLLPLLAMSVIPASANERLASSKACIACHQATVKVVGPSWREIATKYAGGSVTAAQLAESIKRGGSGKWGPVPMPAQSTLSDADALTLATWILGQGQPSQ